MEEETEQDMYTERIFAISKNDSAPRKVQHFQMTVWSEKKIYKSTPIDLLELLQKVKKCHKNQASPLVVHCRYDIVI